MAVPTGYVADIKHQFAFTVTQGKLNKVLENIALNGINILAISFVAHDCHFDVLLVPQTTIKDILDYFCITYKVSRVSHITFAPGIPGTFYSIIHAISCYVTIHSTYLTEDGGMIIASNHPDAVNEIVMSLR